MRNTCSAIFLLCALSALPLSAVEPDALSTVTGTVAPALTDKQEQVRDWLKARVPACPEIALAAAANKFLEELSRQNPAAYERAGGPGFSAEEFSSAVLRHLGTQLGAPAQAAVREDVARQRLQSLIALQPAERRADPAAAWKRLQEQSPGSLRRLLEGRMEDEELARFCRAAPTAGENKTASPAKAKVWTAGEIVSEFARRNQTGAATTRLRAYLVEARLQRGNGAAQSLMLYKIRPDSFRLHLQLPEGGSLVLAYDGSQYWRQAPGRPPEAVAAADLGELRYAREFVDPLFESEGLQVERRADGESGGRKCYRVALRRTDGSGYTALIDQENFREIARENSDGSRIEYSDFRDFAGLQLAYRESQIAADGSRSTLEIVRLAANPGLVASFFSPPSLRQLDLGMVERLFAQAEKSANRSAP